MPQCDHMDPHLCSLPAKFMIFAGPRNNYYSCSRHLASMIRILRAARVKSLY